MERKIKKQYTVEFIQKAKTDDEAMNELLSEVFIDSQSLLYYQGARGDVQDLAQDVSINIYISIKKGILVGTNFRTFLYTSCYNRFIDDYRKKKRLKESNFFPEFIMNNDNLEKKMMQKDAFSYISRIIPSKSSALMLLTAFGYLESEKAFILDQPKGTIKAQINRYRNYLRERKLILNDYL